MAIIHMAMENILRDPASEVARAASAASSPPAAGSEAAGEETFLSPFYGGGSQVSEEVDNRMGELLTLRITPAEFVEALQRSADDALANPDITVIKRYAD